MCTRGTKDYILYRVYTSGSKPADDLYVLVLVLVCVCVCVYCICVYIMCVYTKCVCIYVCVCERTLHSVVNAFYFYINKKHCPLLRHK